VPLLLLLLVLLVVVAGLLCALVLKVQWAEPWGYLQQQTGSAAVLLCSRALWCGCCSWQ
jgi:hypothetical protein